MSYDPRSALRMFRKAKQDGTAIAVEASGLVDASGTPAAAPVTRPQTLCVLLVGFVFGTSVLPDDFDRVEKSAGALKAHTRPDGGVFLGAFEMPHDPAGVVVVFGDPLMEMRDVIAASQRFRADLLEQMQHFDAAKALGPFGKPKVVS